MSLRHLSFSKGFPSFCGKAGFLFSPSAGLTPISDPSASASDELFSDFAKSSFWLLGGRTCAGTGFEFWQNSPSNPGLHWHLGKYFQFSNIYNIAKVCFAHCSTSRLALGSSGCCSSSSSPCPKYHFMMFWTIQTIYFLKALSPRISKLIFPSVSYTNTQTQIHKYTNTAYDKVPERLNM